MSQPQGGQGVGGGVDFNQMRRRFGQGGFSQDPNPQGPTPVQAGGPNPAPPSAPQQSQAPVQDGGGMTIQAPQGGPGGQGMQGVGVGNPYAAPSTAGGTGPKDNQSGMPLTGQSAQAPGQTPQAVSVKPGAPIGPGAPEPKPGGDLASTGKPAGGQFGGATPQNPSPQGPSRMGGPMMKPAIGAPRGGGWQQPNWGVPGSGSAGQGNMARPMMPPPQSQPYGQALAEAQGFAGPDARRGGGPQPNPGFDGGRRAFGPDTDYRRPDVEPIRNWRTQGGGGQGPGQGGGPSV